MIESLKSTFEQLQSATSLINSLKEYIERHVTSVKAFVNNLINALSRDDQSLIPSNPDQGLIIKALGTSSTSEVYYATYGMIADEVNWYLDNPGHTLEECSVQVRTLLGDTVNISLAEVVERFRDNLNATAGLEAVLDSVHAVVRGDSEDFIQTLRQYLDASNIADTFKNSILSGMLSITSNLGSVSKSNVLKVLHPTLALFGLNASSGSVVTSPLSTYAGVNALNTVLSDYLNNVSAFFSNFSTAVSKVFGFALAGLFELSMMAAEGLTDAVVGWFNNLTGMRDCLTYMGKGDGHISIDYSYNYPSTLGSWQAQYLSNLFTSLEDETSITSETPFGTFYCTQTNPTNPSWNFSFIPKVIDPYMVCSIFYDAFGFSMEDVLPYIPRNGKLKLHGMFYTHTVTLAQVQRFFKGIAEHIEELYTIPDRLDDADMMYGIYVAQWLASFYGSMLERAILGSAQEWDDSSTFNGIQAGISNGLFQAWNLYPNYDATNDEFEPQNWQMGILVCSLQPDSSAWAYVNGQSTISNVQTFTAGYMPLLNSFAHIAHATWANTDSSSIFIPYMRGIISMRPNWAIASDQDNIDKVSGMLKKGAIVLGLIAVTTTLIVVTRRIKTAAFSAEAAAGSLSWAAAEDGDMSKMRAAYKMQKKANLLNRLAGGISSASASGFGAISSPDVIRVGRLIKTNFE